MSPLIDVYNLPDGNSFEYNFIQSNKVVLITTVEHRKH